MRRKDFLRTAGLGVAGFSLIQKSGKRDYDKLIRPKKLNKGDTVALTAPAGIVYDESEFDRMKRVLESFGLNVVFGEFVKERFGYLAGTDRERARDLNRFFADPEIDGIVAVRGGWGCARILPYLDFEMIKENPKIYCGFSDNTTLHMAFLHRSNLISFHGPNGTSDWTDLTKQSFKSVLMDGDKAEFHSESEVEIVFPGIVEGRLMGGNLSILTTTLGTDIQPDTKEAILFVEDIGEPVYKIDRMLVHLKQAGVLDNLNGFIFGRCAICPDPSDSHFTLKEILQQHIRPLGIPAVMGMDISHDPDNFTIPQGVMARFDADQKYLKLLESAVQS
ncbi:S66 peptidase family protein [Rhodohalobacter barkolensis]|uniref:LD-carboxypeptidase n=1 Tax=Rhodohalobacter barkolensis TaxID=2053187 RepID=A0A2N0VKV9_9BACT|nr:LD-carboxypeptidase [Rhodohalobacter barkolensis]PKD44826.1 LD-carboxypeptidase [Rhodohalobacter barkolensis]